MFRLCEIAKKSFNDGATVLTQPNCVSHVGILDFKVAAVFECREDQGIFDDKDLHPFHATRDQQVVDGFVLLGELSIPAVSEFVGIIGECEALSDDIGVPEFLDLVDGIRPEIGVRHLIEEDRFLFLAEIPLYPVGEPAGDEVLCQ